MRRLGACRQATPHSRRYSDRARKMRLHDAHAGGRRDTISFPWRWCIRCARQTGSRRNERCVLLRRGAEHDLSWRSISAITSTAWRKNTARCRGSCLPATTSTRSPTAFTPRPGPPTLSPNFTIDTFPAGTRTIAACATRWAFPSRRFGRPMRRQKRRCFITSICETNAGMDADLFTIGFARRAATYKRADLLFTDIERLKAIASRRGGLQIVYAGKAHPQDEAGKEQIRKIFSARDQLRDKIKIAYLENYSMEIGKIDDRRRRSLAQYARCRRWKRRAPAA